jgi:hypothetical protein
MPRNNDIVDWAKTVKDTLAQLGGKQKPAKPKPRPAPKYSSIGMGASSRNRNRIDTVNRRRNLAAAKKRGQRMNP